MKGVLLLLTASCWSVSTFACAKTLTVNFVSLCNNVTLARKDGNALFVTRVVTL